MDWELVPTLSDELQFAQTHPLDPHKPTWSRLMPEALRPYPSFEGWCVRIWDSKQEFSAAVIMATNYAPDESQVTILFARGKGMDGKGSRDAVKYGYTYAFDVKTKVEFLVTLAVNA